MADKSQELNASPHPIGTEDEGATKRRNLGRKGRRRKKKAAEIEEAASAAKRDETSSVSTSILPTDREYKWPAVKELRKLNDEDRQALVAQLGYFPGNSISVAARVSDAFPDKFPGDSSPLVLKLYPLVLRDESDSTKARRKRKRHEEASQDGDRKKEPLVEPFPTILWVTHPRFKAEISKLELNKRGTRFEQKLKEDAKSLESMKQAHKDYGQERHDMITSKDQEWIKHKGWEAAFAPTRGVAGIRNHASIKCLHAHAAHYWNGCKENVVGEWVAEELADLLNGE